MGSFKDKRLLLHIQQSIAEINEIMLSGKQSFLENRIYNLAVMRLLHMVSESAGLLSEDVKQQAPEVEWAKLKGFRNFVVHEYLGDVDYHLIWMHMEHDLPILKNAILKALETYHDH